MSREHRARKRFGQNFLVDERAIFEIVDAIRPNPNEPLIEIGPGLGALTRPILEIAGKLTVIELDRDLIAGLELLKGVTVIHNDVLKVDFSEIYQDQPLRIIGNLPYNISTPIIFHLLESLDKIEDMHFMLQREVVERMAAEPNSREYGRLSVMVQRYCEVIPLLEIAPEAFDPAPKVTSQFVRLVPYQEERYEVANEGLFEAVVKEAFAMKRKMIRNNLKNLLTEAELERCGITPTDRPENLTVDQYVAITNYLVERDQ